MAGPDFSRRTVPTPATPGAVPMTPGSMPLPTGQVVITDDTRRELTKLGWQDGDPIPGDLGERISEIRAQVAQERAAATPALPPDFVPPKSRTVSIDDLPEAYQQELRDHIAKTKAMMPAIEAAQAQEAKIAAMIPEGSSPEMAAAMRTNAAAAQQVEMRKAAEAVTKQGPTASVSASVQRDVVSSAPPPDGKVVAGVQGISPAFAALEEAKLATQAATAPAPPPATEPEPPPPDAGLHAMLENCPRCLWDLRVRFDAEPDERDKTAFVASILGSSRFVKQYDLLDGNVSITYRSLTTFESSLLMTQMGYDATAGQFAGDGDFFARLMEYRLVMSVQKIQGKDDKPFHDIPPIGDIPYDPPIGGAPETPLVPMRKWFYEVVLTQETFRHMIGQQHRQFQRMVEKLETMSDSPDFW